MRSFGGPKGRRSRRPAEPSWKKLFGNEGEDELKAKLAMSISDIGLQVRTVNALENMHIFQVADLVKQERETLLSISNFGEKTLEECRKAVDALRIQHPNWNKARKKKRK